MNIFVVDSNPTIAAQSLCDTHVSKMPLESAQMLSTAVRLTNGNTKVAEQLVPLTKDGNRTEVYKVAYQNHPCTVWARETKANFLWLKDHALALCVEFQERFGHHHASFPIIASCMEDSIPDGPLTQFAMAMPDTYRSDDPVASYRKYYINDKRGIAKWNHTRKEPEWYIDGILNLAATGKI